jgi:hypothetical protein
MATKTVSDERIRQLRAEAAAAGDQNLVQLCDRLLAGAGDNLRRQVAWCLGAAQ